MGKGEFGGEGRGVSRESGARGQGRVGCRAGCRAVLSRESRARGQRAVAIQCIVCQNITGPQTLNFPLAAMYPNFID